MQFQNGAIYLEQSNIRTSCIPVVMLHFHTLSLCFSSWQHSGYIWWQRKLILTLSRVLSWLSIPKACYGLHEATFLPKSAVKSTQQTDIKLRKLLPFFPLKMSETFGTSAGILSAMSWQRPCPWVQRSWRPAWPRCCCTPSRGTCSPTSWWGQIRVAENMWRIARH